MRLGRNVFMRVLLVESEGIECLGESLLQITHMERARPLVITVTVLLYGGRLFISWPLSPKITTRKLSIQLNLLPQVWHISVKCLIPMEKCFTQSTEQPYKTIESLFLQFKNFHNL